MTALVYLHFLIAPATAQEGYTVKERLDEIYRQVREINEKLDSRYLELRGEITANRERINKLEIYIWLIGVGAVALGSVIREFIIKGIRRNNYNWTAPKKKP